MSDFALPGATPAALLAALGTTMARALEMWDGGRGFAAIRREWLDRALPVDAPLEVRLGAEPIPGRFQTIDDRGRLVLAADRGGLMTIDAADVFLKDHDLMTDRGKR